MNMVFVTVQLPPNKLSDAIGGLEPSRSASLLI
jgi:hypothetical protein